MNFSKIPVNIAFVIIAFLLQLSCNNQSLKQKQGEQVHRNAKSSGNLSGKEQVFEIIKPVPNQAFKPGEKVQVSLKKKEGSSVPDSVKIILGEKSTTYIGFKDFEFNLENSNNPAGTRRLTVETYSEGTLSSRISRNITILSDIVPRNYTYKVIKVYPHDKNAYTQGLVYEDGFLYEGTGQRGKSSLRKIEAESGELVASLNLPPDIFGEGICIVGDKIIQLTWTSGIGFVYDKRTFKFLNKINYATQGWGITYDGKDLIMSDGTNNLIFLDPVSYTEKKRIEVYDNQGAVNNLNELEFIDGLVYANIYTTNKIAMIDPEDGKILSYIHLDGLLKDDDRHPGLDVLNGIAWDAAGERLFVTGKNWPKLFEIQLVN